MGGKQTDPVMPRGVAVHGKSLRLTFSYKGQRCRESLGLPPTKTNVKFAAGKLAAIRHEIKTGTFNYAAHFPNSERAKEQANKLKGIGARIGELCKEYQKMKYTDLATSSQRRYSVAFDQCLAIIGVDRLMDSLFPEDFMNLRAELLATRAASTANHYMNVFRGFVQFLEKNKYTKHNLLAELAPAQDSGTEPDPFDLDEFQRAVAACNNEIHRNIITFSIYTGIRPGELAALAWEDIDLIKGKATISRALSDDELKLPKTNKTRVILLSPPAIAALLNQRQYTAMMPAQEFTMRQRGKKPQPLMLRPVFLPETTAKNSGFGQLFLATSFNDMWQALLRRAGVRYRTFYQLRHTYACWNLTAHGNVAFIAKQMGHADYTMLVKIYGRWMDNESEAENARIWEALSEKGHDDNAPKTPQVLQGAK